MIKNRTALRERTGVGIGHEKGERKGIYNLLLCQRTVICPLSCEPDKSASINGSDSGDTGRLELLLNL